MFLRAMVAGSLFISAASSPAQDQMLYSNPTGTLRSSYNGAVGCQFQVGPSNVVVSHLGFYDNGNDGLSTDHKVGIYSFPTTTPSLLRDVVVPAGTDAYLENGYRWMPLDPPMILSSNTTYLVAGVVSNLDGDLWPDVSVPTWNTYFVGSTNAPNARSALYGPGYADGTPIVWPAPYFTYNSTNDTYENVNLANLQIGQALCGVQTTNISMGAGTLTIIGFASGAPTITYQWYTNSLSTPLAGQTSPTLVIANATAANSGTYFLTASNSLGGEQSANVTVLITAFPPVITQQPTNLAVFQNYTASFSCIATGTPPLSYFWSSNGVSVTGAVNGTNFSETAQLANNGNVYSCLVSNNLAATPYTTSSSNATLTVIPNLALPQQILHGARANTATNNAAGSVGGQFTVGNSPVTVTHLGYYASVFTDANKTNGILTQNHRVGIFSANTSVLYGYVTVPAGTNPVVNGYMWAPLEPVLVLSANTQYMLVAEVFSGTPTPDPWGDTYVIPDLNPYFASACDATYWGAYPPTGVAGGYSGQMYSAPNLAILTPSIPEAFIVPTNVTVYAGTNATLTAYVVGQPPLTLQWYTNGIPLAGQTNLTMTLTNLGLADSSTNYYVIATNSVTHASIQSSNASVTVLADTPSITQDILPQVAFTYQNPQFVAAAAGEPPLSYRWTFNSTPIAGATNSTLTLTDVSAASVGNYRLIVTNNFGSATSSVASLSVEFQTWGSYPAAVMNTNLLLYYPLNDAGSGNGIATNWGSLGFAYIGFYTNGYSPVAGPTNLSSGFTNSPIWTNLAVSLDDLSLGYVEGPPLGSGLVVSNLTIAAWVNDGYPGSILEQNMTIFFQRSTYVFGLSVNPDPTNNADELRFTWNGTGYSFDSFLDLPTNQWAFVAMVVNPTNVALYLQNGSGMRSTNFSGTYPSATFVGVNLIGWDSAGGNSARYWDGDIADVMVFNSALSPVAVNALYLGVPASAALTIAPSGNNLVVAWPGGTLMEATNLITGPWTPTIGATNGTYILKPAAPAAKQFKIFHLYCN